MRTPQTAIERATPEFPLLGWHVMYRISRVAIPVADLETLLDHHGFGAFKPQLPPPRIALGRAVAAWVDQVAAHGTVQAVRSLDGQGDEDEDDSARPRQQLIREVPTKRGTEWLVFALVDEAADVAELSLTYGTALRILLHTQHGHLVCTTTSRGLVELPSRTATQRRTAATEDSHEAAAQVLAESEAAAGPEGALLTRQLRPLWDHYRQLVMSNEVSRLIRQIIASMQSVAVRGRGGVYFVPYRELDTLERLNRLIADLPTLAVPAASERRPFLYATGVIDRPAAKRSLAVALHAGMMDEVDAAAKKLARFTAMEAGTVRQATIVERVQDVRAVRAKAAAYADLLGLQHERVTTALATLEAHALAVVMKGEVVIDPASLNTPEVAFIPAPPTSPTEASARGTAPVGAQDDAELLALLEST